MIGLSFFVKASFVHTYKVDVLELPVGLTCLLSKSVLQDKTEMSDFMTKQMSPKVSSLASPCVTLCF